MRYNSNNHSFGCVWNQGPTPQICGTLNGEEGNELESALVTLCGKKTNHGEFTGGSYSTEQATGPASNQSPAEEVRFGAEIGTQDLVDFNLALKSALLKDTQG